MRINKQFLTLLETVHAAIGQLIVLARRQIDLDGCDSEAGSSLVRMEYHVTLFLDHTNRKLFIQTEECPAAVAIDLDRKQLALLNLLITEAKLSNRFIAVHKLAEKLGADDAFHAEPSQKEIIEVVHGIRKLLKGRADFIASGPYGSGYRLKPPFAITGGSHPR